MSFIGHYCCDVCGSSDGLAVYQKEDEESGATYFDATCFAGCGKRSYTNNQLYNTTAGNELGVELISFKPRDNHTGGQQKPMKPVMTEDQKEIFKIGKTHTPAVMYRGLTNETLKFFGVLHDVDENREVTKQHYPITYDYKLSGYKTRVVEGKKFFSEGRTGAECNLFGQFRFRSGGKKVLVTGGEIDMLTMYQVLKTESEAKGYDAWPVVSPTIGENCVSQLKANYEFFDSFDQILLGFDNDEAGRKATEEAIEVLPKGKVYLVNWPDKDPNESLLKGKSRQLINACWQARKHIPAGITGSGSLEEKMREYVSMERLTLPPFMHRMQKMLCGGIPFGYIVNLLAGSGVGKSTVVDAMIIHWIMQNPYKVGIMSLEASEGEYGVNLSSSYCGFKLNLLETAQERLDCLDEPENAAKRQELWFNEDGEERFFILDADIDNLQRKTEYGIISLGWKVIVYDPLQDIFDCLDDDQQKRFMKWQKDIVKRHGVIIININHSRKASSGQKSASRGADLSEEDMMGTSTIFKSGGINIVIGRDKEAEDPIERNTTYAKLTKARGVGNTGPAGSWYYDNPSHTMYDKEDYFRGKGVSLEDNTSNQEVPVKF